MADNLFDNKAAAASLAIGVFSAAVVILYYLLLIKKIIIAVVVVYENRVSRTRRFRYHD